MNICFKCKYRNLCSGKCIIKEKINQASPRKINLDFSGSSPPDTFIGYNFYPNVYTGILAPPSHNGVSRMGSPEEWFKERLTIADIITLRASMVYSRFVSNIKKPRGRLLETMQEVSMAKKPCSMEFNLKKRPSITIDLNSRNPPIGNPAPLRKARLEENPKVPRKVDYVVSDTDLKAESALMTLYKSGSTSTSMSKILSSGLLGIKIQRKLVPTRWSITSVDSTISKNLIKEIKDYPWINDIQVFHDEYLGNHYEILLLPRQWSFEVIEITKKFSNMGSWHDYETNFKRKSYASNVTGAYYANHLAILEYLAKVRRQASVLVMREIKDEYFFPCGVGILRELTRNAFKSRSQKFSNVKEALTNIERRLNIPINNYVKKSIIIKN